MPLRLRRGTDSVRTSITPVQGEPIYTTDTKKLFIGDGTTAGGVEVGGTPISSSYATTASYVLNSVSSSFASTSATASYVLNAVSSSFATTSTTATTASYVLQAVSSSFATNSMTASYFGGTVTSASFAQTASYVLNAVSSSFSTNSMTASYYGGGVTSASFATTSVTASYVLNSVSSSRATTAGSASVATTASYATTVEFPLNNVAGASGLTSFFINQDLNQDPSGNRNITWADLLTDIAGTNLASDGDSINLNTTITGLTSVTSTSFTGSLQGTATTASYFGGTVTSASFATTSATASYVLNAISSSYALTASYAANAGGGGATVTNPGNNYVITSDGSSGGLVGESNLLFDGTNMTITGSIYMTGSLYRPTLVDWEEKYSSPSISGGSLTLDLLQGNVFSVTIDALVATLSITNPPALNNAGSFVLITTGNGSPYPFVWSNAVTWSGGSAPTLSSGSGKKDIYGFISLNQGTNWYGFIGVQNV